MSLAELIRTRRNELGISQVQLGIRADLTQRTISELETGTRRRPTLRVLRQVSHALDIPLEELVMAAGFAESEERARAMAEEVQASAEEDPALSAVLLDWKHLDDGARGMIRDIVRSIRKNQEAIEKKFKGG